MGLVQADVARADVVRAVMVSKAMVVGAYQRKAEEIAAQGIELTVLTPPAWGDRRGRQVLEAAHTHGYTLRAIPLRFNGHFHFHFYPTLGRELDRLQPHVLHMDEEPYNLATWLALQAAARRSIPALFFSWQNIYRHYPPPFSWLEKSNYARAAAAIAGNAEAAQVLRRKGFGREIVTLPQFGVDPSIFAPPADETDAHTRSADKSAPLRIGYAGGLLAEKGVDLLLAACAELRGAWQLTLAGEGDQSAPLAAQAAKLGITPQVTFAGRVPSQSMPDFLRQLDVLVLPSRTTPRWKEQFGRVLIEAMATGVVVIGSDSGEIPHVIGDAGLLFPEEDGAALRTQLQALADDPTRRPDLRAAGRARVLERYTMHRIAAETAALYARLARQS